MSIPPQTNTTINKTKNKTKQKKDTPRDDGPVVRHRNIALHRQHTRRKHGVANPASELARIEPSPFPFPFSAAAGPSPPSLLFLGIGAGIAVPNRAALRGHAHPGGDVVRRVEAHGGQPHADPFPFPSSDVVVVSGGVCGVPEPPRCCGGPHEGNLVIPQVLEREGRGRRR